MAKGSFWLRGARGKFAGAVAFKGENGTVLRENVTPANPQTSKQMEQRIAFATVTKAASALLPIIGQTFEGASNEKINRREFVAANVNVLRNAYANGDANAAFIPKGLSTIVPNPYIISSGSLPQPNISVETIANGASEPMINLNGAFKIIGVSTLDDYDKVLDFGALCRSLFGVEPGQQLTFVSIYDTGDTLASIPNPDSIGYLDVLRYSYFNSARVVLNSENVHTYSVRKLASADAFSLYVDGAAVNSIQFITSMFNAELSNQQLITLFINSFNFSEDPAETGAANQVDLNFTTILDQSDVSEYLRDLYPDDVNILAATFFVSDLRNKAWKYSTSQFVVRPRLAPSRINYGYSYENAYPTYVKSNDISSDLYTRRGGTSNNING